MIERQQIWELQTRILKGELLGPSETNLKILSYNFLLILLFLRLYNYHLGSF